MNFTPGPWTYQSARNYGGFSIAPKGILPTLASVERCGGNISVECFNFPGETEANARLIAAAPDLFAVCEKLSEACELEGDLLMSLVKEAREALAKVTS